MRAEIPIAQFWERQQQGQNELWLFVALCHTEICFLLSLCGENKLFLFFYIIVYYSVYTYFILLHVCVCVRTVCMFYDELLITE